MYMARESSGVVPSSILLCQSLQNLFEWFSDMEFIFCHGQKPTQKKYDTFTNSFTHHFQIF